MSFEAVDQFSERVHTWIPALTNPPDRLAVDADSEGECAHVGEARQLPAQFFEVRHNTKSEAYMPRRQPPPCGTLVTSQPLTWGDMKKGSKGSAAAETLGAFLSREISAAASERQWAKDHGLEAHKVRRARKVEIETQLDTLQEFADALHVEPWQLLYPGFTRGQPDPEVMKPEAVKAAQLINDLPEARRKMVYAELVRLVEFGRSFSTS